MSRITSDAREQRNRNRKRKWIPPPHLFGAEGKWISSRKIHYFGDDGAAHVKLEWI
jgi:hypothetical protein